MEPRLFLNQSGNPESPKKEVVVEPTLETEPSKIVSATPAEEISAFITQMSLEDSVLPDFENLSEAQKLLVIKNLKQRILDIVKEDANTQYSEELKNALATPPASDHAGHRILQKVMQGLVKFQNSVFKESDIKNLENELFFYLKDSEYGKRLIIEELQNLTNINKDRDVYLDENNQPKILFINPDSIENATPEELQVINKFNQVSNNFREIPYEWGQGEGKKKKQYNSRWLQYTIAQDEVLKIKESREKEKGDALAEVLQMENSVKLDQLLNTHPELEKEFRGLDDTVGLTKEIAKGAGSLLNTVTGKNWINRALMVGGFTARMGTKLVAGVTATSTTIASAITFVAAPIIGATVGGARGYFRGKDTLEERKKQARYGTKDESGEIENSSDAESLAKRLEVLTASLQNDANTPEEQKAKEAKLDQITRRIIYTQDKIEQGLVNFGDAKSTLSNQYNLLNALNNALALSSSLEETTRKNVDDRLEQFLSAKKEKVNEKQKEFIKKQVKQGALYGAGFALAGYSVRWLGEHMGLWGGVGATNSTVGVSENTEITNPDQVSTDIPTEDASTPAPAPEVIPEAETVEPTIEQTDSTNAETQIQDDLNEIEDQINNEPVVEHGFKNAVKFELGEKGVPRNLETVFHAMAADHMTPGADGINEEFGAKSLNMAANMVKLSEGINIKSIDPNILDDFNKAVNFDPSTNTLEIKDPEAFNSLMGELKGHSDQLWEKGVLQGGAVGELDNIKEDSWVKILHADGLDHTGSVGGAEGIAGHDDITIDKIPNWSESDMVQAAKAARAASYAESVEQSGGIQIKGDPNMDPQVTPFENPPNETPTETPIENTPIDQSNWIGGDNEAWDNIKDMPAADLYAKYLNSPNELSVEETEVCRELEKLSNARKIYWIDVKNSNQTVGSVLENAKNGPSNSADLSNNLNKDSNLDKTPEIPKPETKVQIPEEVISKNALEISTEKNKEFIDDLFAKRRLFKVTPGTESELWHETSLMPLEDMIKEYQQNTGSLEPEQEKLIETILTQRETVVGGAPVIHDGESVESYFSRLGNIIATQKIRSGEIPVGKPNINFDGYGPSNE